MHGKIYQNDKINPFANKDVKLILTNSESLIGETTTSPDGSYAFRYKLEGYYYSLLSNEKKLNFFEGYRNYEDRIFIYREEDPIIEKDAYVPE